MSYIRGIESTRKRLKEMGEERNDVVRTPYWLIDTMIHWANLDTLNDYDVLDPCAGDNRMLYYLDKYYNCEGKKVAYEIQQQKFYFPNTTKNSVEINFKDFFSVPYPEEEKNKFDVCLINPPYSNLQGIKFIGHVLKYWLKDHGSCIALLPNYYLDNAEGRKTWLNNHIRRMAIIPKNTYEEYNVSVLHGCLCEFVNDMTDLEIKNKAFGFIFRPENQAENLLEFQL